MCYAISSEIIPAYRDSEWQANRFASELLMPREYIKSNGLSVNDVITQCGVSKQAAEITYNEIYNIIKNRT